MTPQLFSFWGYLSVGLGLAVPLLWLLHKLFRPRRWLCHYAVVVAVVALVCATINSRAYVNRIQIDRSEQLAAIQAKQEAARKAAEAARSDDVAQVRFAEDGAGDYLDEGGMDEADRKYMDSFDKAPPQAGEQGEPEWKQRKVRSQTRTEDDSLEAMLDTTTGEEKGVEADFVEKEAAEPIIMPERQVRLANRLDGLNLKWIRLLILAGLGLVVFDYLSRFNSYEEAYLPLPLPSGWVSSLTPLPAVQGWPIPPRRALPEELTWLLRRGDMFLYVTDDKQAAALLPEQAWRIPRLRLGAVDIIHVTDDAPVAADFIFETLWYGRSSFVVDSAARATALLARSMDLLAARKANRAHVRQSVHIVWDLPTPLPQETVDAFERLGRATGIVLVLRAG